MPGKPTGRSAAVLIARAGITLPAGKQDQPSMRQDRAAAVPAGPMKLQPAKSNSRQIPAESSAQTRSTCRLASKTILGESQPAPAPGKPSAAKGGDDIPATPSAASSDPDCAIFPAVAQLSSRPVKAVPAPGRFARPEFESGCQSYQTSRSDTGRDSWDQSRASSHW